MPSLKAPEKVKIDYRKMGASHIFASPDLPGFSVGNPDLHNAYDHIGPGLAAFVEAKFHVHAQYEPDHSFNDVRRKIEDKEHASQLLSPIFSVRLIGQVERLEAHPGDGTRRRHAH